MRIAYKGAHGSVDVPSAGLFGVERSEPVEVKDDTLAEALLRQGWRKVRSRRNDDDNKNGDDNK